MFKLNRHTEAIAWLLLALAIIIGFIVGELLMQIVEPVVTK